MKAFLVVLLAVFSGKFDFLFKAKNKKKKRSFLEVTEHEQAITTELTNRIYCLYFTGCHANLTWQDKPIPNVDVLKNAFWDYVAKATLTTEEALQKIKQSELGQEIK